MNAWMLAHPILTDLIIFVLLQLAVDAVRAARRPSGCVLCRSGMRANTTTPTGGWCPRCRHALLFHRGDGTCEGCTEELRLGATDRMECLWPRT